MLTLISIVVCVCRIPAQLITFAVALILMVVIVHICLIALIVSMLCMVGCACVVMLVVSNRIALAIILVQSRFVAPVRPCGADRAFLWIRESVSGSRGCRRVQADG